MSFARPRDMSSPKRLVLTLPVALAVVASLDASERAGRKAFQNAWEGRSVVVKRTLYSIVFDERSRVVPLITHRDRVSGLNVVTPTGSSYYQFDARRNSEEDIVDQDPDRIVSKMRNQYVRSKHLDDGATQDVEPLMLVRYSDGQVSDALVKRAHRIAADRRRAQPICDQEVT